MTREQTETLIYGPPFPLVTRKLATRNYHENRKQDLTLCRCAFWYLTTRNPRCAPGFLMISSDLAGRLRQLA